MKMTIYKYELETTDRQEIEMPIGAEILTIQVQNEKACIWVLVDPSEKKEYRTFEIYGTGYDIHYDMGVIRDYLGTYQLGNGAIVFHVFQRIN